jgi:hypothetical protein
MEGYTVRSIEKSSDLIGNRTCDLPACSIMPQPTALPHTPEGYTMHINFILHRIRNKFNCFLNFWKIVVYYYEAQYVWTSLLYERWGRKLSLRNWGTIHVFAWRQWGMRKTSTRIAAVQAKIRTKHLANASAKNMSVTPFPAWCFLSVLYKIRMT